jgi:hypothetical protein
VCVCRYASEASQPHRGQRSGATHAGSCHAALKLPAAAAASIITIRGVPGTASRRHTPKGQRRGLDEAHQREHAVAGDQARDGARGAGPSGGGEQTVEERARAQRLQDVGCELQGVQQPAWTRVTQVTQRDAAAGRSDPCAPAAAAALRTPGAGPVPLPADGRLHAPEWQPEVVNRQHGRAERQERCGERCKAQEAHVSRAKAAAQGAAGDQHPLEEAGRPATQVQSIGAHNPVSAERCLGLWPLEQQFLEHHADMKRMLAFPGSAPGFCSVDTSSGPCTFIQIWPSRTQALTAWLVRPQI